MRAPPYILALALVIGSATPTQAESYAAATAAYCEKVKQCVLLQLRTARNIHDADRRMMLNQVDGMCVSLQQTPMAPINSSYHGMATMCMRSMANLSCAQINTAPAPNPTPQCAAFSRATQ